MNWSECEPALKAQLIAACAGDRANARELYEDIAEDGYTEAVLEERARCVSHVDYALARGDIMLAQPAVLAGTPAHTLPTCGQQRVASLLGAGGSLARAIVERAVGCAA